MSHCPISRLRSFHSQWTRNHSVDNRNTSSLKIYAVIAINNIQRNNLDLHY